MGTAGNAAHREPWNKGKIVGQKSPFRLKDIWAVRVCFQMEHRLRELALFSLGIDRKLRGCELVALKVHDVCHGVQVATRAIVLQHKTQRPVQFEIPQATRDALQAWVKPAGPKSDDFLFPSPLPDSPHLGTRQHARILGHWVDELGLDRADYGTHSMRRTEATLIYRAHEAPARRAAAAGPLQAGLSPAPNYVPYLLDALIFRGEAARPLDIAMLLTGQFRLRGDHLGAFLRESRCAGPRDRRHIC